MKSKYDSEPLRTCVSPLGVFRYGVHAPRFRAANQRETDHLVRLGTTDQGRAQMNQANFPAGDVVENSADTIFEIPNPFPFRGATFICKSWADSSAARPESIRLPDPGPVSMFKSLERSLGQENISQIESTMIALPRPVQLALATTSTDPRDLMLLAAASCRFVLDKGTNRPGGLSYHVDDRGKAQPVIHDQDLFEAVANNAHLPADYREAMVLRPGVQGGNEIVGEWRRPGSHIYEYLRRNSYIPWGHYAANMAHDAVRYAAGDLTPEDIQGLRHLYYQRTYLRVAEMLHIDTGPGRTCLSPQALENLRSGIVDALDKATPESPLAFSATLWGWNYGFDFAPSGYRLHASHQQIHQQFALVPDRIEVVEDAGRPSGQTFACGDLVQAFIRAYRRATGKGFFDCYLNALRANRRMDQDKSGPADLVVYEDENVMLFVPKAQTSQWELQIMPLAPVGNILETDAGVRRSLDRAMLIAMRILSGLGAAMVTVIEYSKRFNVRERDQHLLYAFLPRLPQSPGAFSEAQQRWINGHYPEDFARACRLKLNQALEVFKA